MAGFADKIGAWAAETEDRVERVSQTAVGDLATELSTTENNGGSVPHITGNLANSLLASTAAMPSQGAPGEEYKTPGVDPGALAASLNIEDTVWLGYRANYAHRVNYGFVGQDSLGRSFNQPGHHFVEDAVVKWQAIVDGAVAKVKG